MPKDGSCFYHALTFSLFGTLDASLLLRKIIATYIKTNWNTYKDFLPGVDRESYFVLHSSTSEMASAPQIQAAADVLGLFIRIKSPTDEWNFAPQNEASPVRIVMRFTGPIDSGHFDALIPKAIFGLLMDAKLGNKNKNLNDQMPTTNSKGPDIEVCKERSVAVTRSERIFEPKTSDPVEENKVPGHHVKLQPVPIREESGKSGLEKIINLDACHTSYPLKIKINGRKLVGFINDNLDFSILAPANWLIDEDLQPFGANVDFGQVKKQVKGIFFPKINVSKEVSDHFPIIVSDLPEGTDLILGKNFIEKFSCKYVPKDDVYVFYLGGHTVTKSKPRIVSSNAWEILKVSEAELGKLFKVHIKVDGLKLLAALDLGAVRTIINRKFCTSPKSLKPAKIKLRTAGDTLLNVDGVYTASITVGNTSVPHPVVSAPLPSTIDILIGNDFLAKYKATASWETECAYFLINDTRITLKRVPGPDEKQKPPVSPMYNIGSNCKEKAIPVFSTRQIHVQPGEYNMVEGRTTVDIIPAIVSPVLIENNPSVTSMECLMLDSISVPVFNCTENEICIPSGTKIGYVEPENKEIDLDLITRTNLAEIKYALNHNLLILDEISSPDLPCLLTADEKEPSIPCLENADITEKEKK